jgi:hypothetical protein
MDVVPTEIVPDEIVTLPVDVLIVADEVSGVNEVMEPLPAR